MSDTWSFTLNGRAARFEGGAMTRLLDVLREDLGLTGTKEGCGEGECGACAVTIDGEVVCACLVPVFQVESRAVRTVEDVARGDELDPLQAILVERGGVQCGACTPGVVLTLRTLLDRRPDAGRDEVRAALAGNLCRCTGYERILRAVEELVGADGGADR